MIQKLTWLHFIGCVGYIYFIRTINLVFAQSEIKTSWPAGLQKPGHVNASALVGITICRVKAKKFAWCNTLYKWTVSCNVFVASSRHLHIVQSGPLYSALVWEVDVSSRHIQFPGVIRRGPNGVSCYFATKHQNWETKCEERCLVW